MSDHLKRRLVEDKPLTKEYPPRVHQVHRLTRLLNQHQICDLLQVTPLTARRILKGCDLKLSQALKLSRRLGLKVEELWEVL